jgi:uncharacterized peroxidase-related enzyme
MKRIKLPTSDQIPATALPLLDAVKKQLGVAPHLIKLLGYSPAALEGYLNLNGALSKGTLDAKTRKRIALSIAEINGCNYCLSAHTYLGKNVAKLDDAEIAANRHGVSSDPKAAAAVHFAIHMAQKRDQVSDTDFNAVKAAGYTQAKIVEIVLHVALNTLTNFINVVAQTEIDFPLVSPLPRAAA